ncbi:MAG TPA: bifunctional folylpolyglutamate synthase/dihydrofolate synthase, partial [Psychrobacter sp.]|nr:bifunctional folylpolyglutamate synthase/dihydrofolate synthase [Psychrobacter sp.]
GVLAKYIDTRHVHDFDGLQAATEAVIQASQPQDLIVVCGSFHTIGEALAALAV